MTEVIEQYAADKPRSEEEIKKEEHLVQKLRDKIGFLKEQANDSKNLILKIKKGSDMSDNEIRANFIESKGWEKTAAELIKSRNDIKIESVGLNIEAKEIFDIKEVVQASLDVIKNKIDDLRLEDERRGLFTAINKNISRENVAFPENFTGEW